jgi:hypothetical protein
VQSLIEEGFQLQWSAETKTIEEYITRLTNQVLLFQRKVMELFDLVGKINESVDKLNEIDFRLEATTRP